MCIMGIAEGKTKFNNSEQPNFTNLKFNQA